MTIYSGFSHWKWWFPIVMLVYQRVSMIKIWTFCHGPVVTAPQNLLRRSGCLVSSWPSQQRWHGPASNFREPNRLSGCVKKGALRIFSLLKFVIFRFLRFSNSLLMFVDISTVCAKKPSPMVAILWVYHIIYIYVAKLHSWNSMMCAREVLSLPRSCRLLILSLANINVGI